MMNTAIDFETKVSVINQMMENRDMETLAVQDYLDNREPVCAYVLLYESGYISEINDSVRRLVDTSWEVLMVAKDLSDEEYDEQFGGDRVAFEKSTGYFLFTPYPFTKDN